MPERTQAKANDSGVHENQAKTRLLLALWDMGGAKEGVNKSLLTKRVVQKNLKVSDYQGIFDRLEKEEAITIAKNKFSLTSKGVEMLDKMLKSGELKFGGTIVGTWAANALLRWITQMDGAVSTPAVPAKTKEKAIASYEKFEHVALEVYDRLNREHNMNDLVPIYRIRREIGERVSRSHFNEWLMEMQSNDIFLLMAGEMRDMTPDKREDSIETSGGGLRYYAKRLNS
ncbi:MAG TPA: hypothetical protein V6D11_10950 [Waterburya sp.]|jgi:predicted transcriptional regulator